MIRLFSFQPQDESMFSFKFVRYLLETHFSFDSLEINFVLVDFHILMFHFFICEKEIHQWIFVRWIEDLAQTWWNLHFRLFIFSIQQNVGSNAGTNVLRHNQKHSIARKRKMEHEKISRWRHFSYWGLVPSDIPYKSSVRTIEEVIFVQEIRWFLSLNRFLCNTGHVWESGWATILCRFHLNSEDSEGKVLIRTYGQRCTTCQNDEIYYRPVFDSERVWQAIQHILYRILITYYREHDEEVEKRHTIVARHFRLENPNFKSPNHPQDFCEACKAGHCIMKWDDWIQKYQDSKW